MTKRELETSPETPGGFLRLIRTRKKKNQKSIMERCKTLGVSVINVSDVETNSKVKLHSLDKVAKLYTLTGPEKKKLRQLIVNYEEQGNSTVRGNGRAKTGRKGGLLGESTDPAQEELRIFYDLMQLPEEARERVISAASAYYSPSRKKKAK